MLRPRWNSVEIMSYQCWDNVETTLWNIEKWLYQSCATLIQRCSMSDTNIVSKLWNAENKTSDFASFSTLDQRYFNVDQQRWNNFDPKLKCLLGGKQRFSSLYFTKENHITDQFWKRLLLSSVNVNLYTKLRKYVLFLNVLTLIRVCLWGIILPTRWFYLNNSEAVKAVTLAFCSIQ